MDTPTQQLEARNGDLPSVVVADPNNIALTPNEMRALRAATGRTISDLFSDGNEEDAMQAVVWLALRREGYTATWDQAGDVGMSMDVAKSDPTPTKSWPPGPGSAGSGE